MDNNQTALRVLRTFGQLSPFDRTNQTEEQVYQLLKGLIGLLTTDAFEKIFENVNVDNLMDEIRALMPPRKEVEMKYVSFTDETGKYETFMLPTDPEITLTSLQDYFFTSTEEGQNNPTFLEFVVWAKAEGYLRMPTSSELRRIEKENE